MYQLLIVIVVPVGSAIFLLTAMGAVFGGAALMAHTINRRAR